MPDERAMSASLTGISSMAMREVLAELTAAYERRTGQHVSVVSVGGVDAARRIEAGEAFDFVVLAREAIERLESIGRIQRDSRLDLAHSDVAVAVASGARRPNIADASALRNAVLDARSIGYSTGPSGTHLARLFARWGIAEVVASRIVQARPGVPVATLIARGEVELGFQQLSELINLPGIEVVGVLPPEVRIVTVFSAAACAASAQRDAVRRLLAFLASADADDVKYQHGMKPAPEDAPSRAIAASIRG
jgi:molybdate transport system substrate-binding protein